MTLDDLFREGWLKRIPPSPDRARQSLEVAARYIDRAKRSLEIKLFDMAIIAAYSAAFHAARSVLFLDGVGERSHFAIHAYLKGRHPDLGIQEIETFDQYRKLRHAVAYGLETQALEADAKSALRWAEVFLKKVRAYAKV
jgi:uncharacterized protein (UPF0332 family)